MAMPVARATMATSNRIQLLDWQCLTFTIHLEKKPTTLN